MTAVKRRRAAQYVSLVGANIASAGINLITVWVLTNILAPVTFARYRYAIVFLNFASVVCQLGIPYGTSVALARDDDPARARLLIRLTARAMVAISVVASLLTVGAVLLLNAIGQPLDPVILYAAPLIALPTLQAAWIEMLKGANRIGDIAAQTMIPYALILVGSLAAALIFGKGYPLATMLAIHTLAYLLMHVVTWARFRQPATSEEKAATGRAIKDAQRTIGLNVYIGALVGVGTTNLIGILVGKVVGMENYGAYALALSMCAPMQMIPAVMGSVMFRENARAQYLSRRSISATFGLAAVALAGFMLAMWLVFDPLFPDAYDRSLGYCWWLAPAFTLMGLGDYFNRFIGAKGRSSLLRHGAIATGVVNLTVTLSLLWTMGVTAAIIGTMAAGITYLCAMVLGYRTVVRDAARVELASEPDC